MSDNRIPIILYLDDDECTRAGTLMPCSFGTWSLLKAGPEPVHLRVVGKFATLGEAKAYARARGWFVSTELRQ